MTPDADCGEPATDPGTSLLPAMLAVCRWLPTERPAGAFSGRHDRVHINERHGLVNLWSEHRVLHTGDHVGPPRGGLVPGTEPDYDVAMPLGGYLQVRAGILRDWADEPAAVRLIRADGEAFSPGLHSPTLPYFLYQYRRMTESDVLHALLHVRRRLLSTRDPDATPTMDSTDPRHQSQDTIDSLLRHVATATAPVVCRCDSGGGPTPWPDRCAAPTLPTGLLRHSGAIATLTGLGSPEDASDVVWQLTRELADSATSMSESVAEAPLNEEAVALVAGQAVRWHGTAVVGALPLWTLGWIFLAEPLLSQVAAGDRSAVERVQEWADRVRVQRTQLTWATAHSLAERAHDSQDQLDTAVDLRTPASPGRLLDVIARELLGRRQRGRRDPYSTDIASALALETP